MENLDSSLKAVPYFYCEKGDGSVPVCQDCDTCVLARKTFSTKEWFWRVGEVDRRRFLVSVLQQLDSLPLLQYFQNILQTTQGKDFIYHRSRVSLSQGGKTAKSSFDQMLHRTVEAKMKETLFWFGKSAPQTKADYTLSLLQLCDPPLLLTATNVVRVLLQRKLDNVSELAQDSSRVFFLPEKVYSPQFKTLHVYWAPTTKDTAFPLSKGSGRKSLLGKAVGKASSTEGPWKSSLQCISEMNRQFSRKEGMPKVGDTPSNLLVDLDAVRDLSSGVSKYLDFIHHLPIHLSKYILSLLDKNSLNRCASVSRHWAVVAQEVKLDLWRHTVIQNQITLLQGSDVRGLDPRYACKLLIPIPKMTEDRKRPRGKNQKWKLRTKNDYNLWTAYQNQETQHVQMEERNVFCGTYNVRLLSDTWDKNRVIHYSGGDLIAVLSNWKLQLLDIIQVKTIPIKFRGHAGSVRALFLCEEENFLLSGSYDLSIRCWDLKSGTCIRTFTGHKGTITCMDLYKNRLVSGARDGHVKEWDVETGKCLKTFKHSDPILATKINDTYVVSGCERGIVRVWHVSMGHLVKTLNGHEGAVRCLCFDQWHLLSGGTDGLVMAWSMVGKYERCLMAYKHPKEVLHVAFLFLRVISACADGKIRIYNFMDGNCLKVMKANGRGDPVLNFFVHGNRMLINTESNVLMFQFENVKWHYYLERAKAKRSRDKEEDREEGSREERGGSQAQSRSGSAPERQTPSQEQLLTKLRRTRVLLKTARLLSVAQAEVPQAQEKPKSPRGDEDARKKGVSVLKKTTGLEDDDEKVQKQGQLRTPGGLTSQSKRTSPDRFINSGESAYPRGPQTQVSDAWGPLISYPRRLLSFKGKSLQRAVDRLRANHPPTDVTQTSVPLEIQKLQPYLKNSLHGPRVQSTIPRPVIIHPRFPGSSKGLAPATSSLGGAGLSVRPLTSTQLIKPNRMLVPAVGVTTPSAKKERPCFSTALDPFRMNTGFMLLTVREEKEYEEAKMEEYHQARKPPGLIDPEKARRAAWIRKIKGLPVDNFMKRGKTAAPELGPNVFI
ncbi:F-box and WD repeat domain containing protein 10B [Saccopteryx leptura]|uniref:F-box and WD repeat domain containing protein 10B n=1 Tax=Saccopteryx leptura TaxID=249018 RepID=UPI00339BD868